MTDRTIDWVFRATDRTAAAFRSVDSKISGLTKSFRTFAGFAGFAALATGVGSLTTKLVQLGSELQDASDTFGISAETLQALKFGAEQTGASFDSLQSALGYLTRLTGNAVNGNKAAVESFRQLGISAERFANLPIDKRLEVVASQLARIQDPAKRLELQFRALGRGSADLAPLLSDGAEGLQKYGKELKETGSILSNDQVKALDDAGDAWDRFSQRLLATAAPALTGTLGVVEDLTDGLQEYFKLLGSGAAMPGGIPRDVVAPIGKGPTNGRRRAPNSPAVIGAPAPIETEQDVAAQIKAAAAAERAQAKLVAEAERYNAEVDDLASDIAKLNSEASRMFDARGREITESTLPPLTVLKRELDEINDLWMAQSLTSEAANAATAAAAGRYVGALDTVKDKTEEVKTSTQEMFESLKLSADGFARDLTDAFFDSTNSIGDMFEDLAETIAKALFTQAVSEPLLTAILGPLASGLNFGGARAMGGPVSGGTSYLVGERGPELFVPGSSGRIIPNGSGESAQPINVNLTITSVDPQTAAQTIARQERLITGMVRRATLRAGRRPALA